MRNSFFLAFLGCVLFAGGYWAGIATRTVSPTLINQTDTQEPFRNKTVPILVMIGEKNESRASVSTPNDLYSYIHQSFYREALDLVIETMSVTDLIPLAASITGFRAEQLWDMQRPRLFAQRFLDLYLEDCSAGDVVDTVFFGKSAENSTSSYVRFRQSDTPRIYAHFSVPSDYLSDEVLVKWCNSTRTFLYAPFPINTTRALNYVWWQPYNPRMEEGDYFVHIYSTDETLRPLALGGYQVVE